MDTGRLRFGIPGSKESVDSEGIPYRRRAASLPVSEQSESNYQLSEEFTEILVEGQHASSAADDPDIDEMLARRENKNEEDAGSQVVKDSAKGSAAKSSAKTKSSAKSSAKSSPKSSAKDQASVASGGSKAGSKAGSSKAAGPKEYLGQYQRRGVGRTPPTSQPQQPPAAAPQADGRSPPASSSSSRGKKLSVRGEFAKTLVSDLHTAHKDSEADKIEAQNRAGKKFSYLPVDRVGGVLRPLPVARAGVGGLIGWVEVG